MGCQNSQRATRSQRFAGRTLVLAPHRPRTEAWLLRPAEAEGATSWGARVAWPRRLGMSAAHNRLTTRARRAGAPDGFIGELYDGPHKLDLAMQQSAFAHLERWLRE